MTSEANIPPIQGVVAIAKEAGAAILRELALDVTVDSKGDGSPVTNADKAADAVIRRGLKQLTPDIPVISEEDTPQERAAANASALRWIVDPLDGTRTALRYAAGRKDYNQFGVHIGLVRGNVPIAGVAYFPAMTDGRGTVYFTGDDGKAYKQVGDDAAKCIQVSRPPLQP
jgi:3'(2'), 5'-bisphosphate nucleotidase